jgi:hypothetical protein
MKEIIAHECILPKRISQASNLLSSSGSSFVEEDRISGFCNM